MRVSVIGGSAITDDQRAVATDLGRLLGERDHTVVCGGLGGSMRAVCAGASEAGGETIGILPGTDRGAANEYVETAIATGMGHARNALVPLNGDAVIALPGGPGTLSELGLSAVYERPVADLGGRDLPFADPVATPSDAVRAVEEATGGR